MNLAEAERRDPLNRMARLVDGPRSRHGEDLEQLAQEEDQRMENTFSEVLAELK